MDMKQTLTDIAFIKSIETQLAEQREKLQADLIAEMTKSGQKSIQTAPSKDGSAGVKGTLVAGQRVTIDSDRLKKALTAKQWLKVTTQTLDKTKLEAAVALNEVDANVVAGCSNVNDVKPYIKVTGAPSSPSNVVGSSKVVREAMAIFDTKGNLKPAARRVKKPAGK